MKIHLSLFAIFFISPLLYAQPVLNGSDINPVAGDQLTYHYTNYINPGLPGANQSWDLSSMIENGFSVITYSNASSTPYGSSFSTANIAGAPNTGTYYSYYNTSSSALQIMGIYDATIMALSDPQDFLRYPFNYMDSYTDHFAGSYVQTTPTGTVMVARSGTYTVNYDGYGTLTIPGNTYTNAVRAHSIFDYYDNGTLAIHEDSYIWFVAGHHMELASVATYSGQTTGSSGFYKDYGITGIQKISATSLNLHVFPNPASNEVHISVPVGISITQAGVYSIDGRQILSLTETSIPINGILTFDTAELAPGVYFIKLISNDALIETKKLVISRQ